MRSARSILPPNNCVALPIRPSAPIDAGAAIKEPACRRSSRSCTGRCRCLCRTSWRRFARHRSNRPAWRSPSANATSRMPCAAAPPDSWQILGGPKRSVRWVARHPAGSRSAAALSGRDADRRKTGRDKASRLHRDRARKYNNQQEDSCAHVALGHREGTGLAKRECRFHQTPGAI